MILSRGLKGVRIRTATKANQREIGPMGGKRKGHPPTNANQNARQHGEVRWKKNQQNAHKVLKPIRRKLYKSKHYWPFLLNYFRKFI